MSNAPNLLGGGMYTPTPINVNQGAFNNGLAGTAVPAGNQEIQNYLGATTQGVNAASSPYAQGAGAGLTSLAGQYQSIANGTAGPSLASTVAQQQGAQNLAASESMLGSARGAGNPAAAQQAAQNAQATGQQQIAQNAVTGNINEQYNALQGLGNTYGALGQLGTTIQGQQNQVGLANQQNVLGANTNYLGALQGIAGQQQQGQMAGQQLAANTQLGQDQIANSAYQAAANNNNKIFGQVLGAAGNGASGFISGGGIQGFGKLFGV